MSWIAWIVIGALAGWIASMIMKKNSEMGAFSNIVVGIIGAFIGGFLVNMIVGVGFTGFNFWSLVVAVVGAVVLLFVIRLFKRAKSDG